MEHLIAWFDAERGRRSRLAEHLKVYPSTISQWEKVPAERVNDVAAFTGIDRELLRPDIYRVRHKSGAAA